MHTEFEWETGGVELTERDIELFRFLNEQKFMMAGQIYAIFWPNCNPRAGSGRQRLKKLLNAGYIRIREIMIKGRLVELIMLTESGIDVLREKGMDHGFSEMKRIRPFFVTHTLKLANIRAIFRELGQTGWQSERVIRKQNPLRGWYPDAILTAHGLKIAIELENSLRSKARCVERIRRYANEREFTLVLFIFSMPYVKGWMLDMDYPLDKVCFVLYDDLMRKKGNVALENRASKIALSSIL